MKIRKEITLDVNLNPEEVAYLLCGMDAEEQAAFFNSVAEQVEIMAWPLT